MIEMFQKFSALDGNIPSQLQYISTHPMTLERLQVLHSIHGAADFVPIELLSDEEWARVKSACQVESSPDAG